MAKKYYFDESGFFFEDKEKTILVGYDIHQDFSEDIYIPSTTKLIKKNVKHSLIKLLKKSTNI